MPIGNDPPTQRRLSFVLGIALALTAVAMISYAFRQERSHY